ncbi:Ig-like domain-containing protein [Pseudomonas sp. UV AK001]|uniref:Ig-like domain-containing protein n=1 Tax=Pseudomonas sp. UV AK001 TaxID=3384791 RepID=UPI0038D45E4A
MSINVNSTQISALLQLYPMAIPGAEENLQPPGAYHLGISESIYSPSTQLFMVIDPFMLFSTPSQAGDSVRLWVNSQATSVIKPIKPGEENDRIFMELPWGVLKDGLNTLYYEVTRVGSGNKDKSDPILNVLFNNPASGITVSHPASIGPGQPATFTLTRSNPRQFDEVELTIGQWRKTVPYVHPADPITYTLTTLDLQQIGDGTHTVSATIKDQLSNFRVSPDTTIVITANSLVLPPPSVTGQTGNNFNPTLQNVEVVVPAGALLPSDKVHVEWEGAISAPGASFKSAQRLVSAGLKFPVPRSVLAYSLGKAVKVTYVIERNGVSTPSQVLPLNILPLPATALIPPKILEADANNVLDVIALGTKNATIHALLWTLIADGMPCWLSLEGKKADGTAHNLALWNGLPARVNPTWVSQGFWPAALVNSYLKQLGDGTSLRIKFAVSMDMSNDRATAVEFPDRVYTIKAVALIVPTIVNVNENTATGKPVANAGTTTATTLVISGKLSPGQQGELYDGSGASAKPLGKVTANPAGDYSRTITVAQGAHRFYIHSLYHPGTVYSNVWTLTVVTALNPGANKTLNLTDFIVAEGRPPAYFPASAIYTQPATGGVQPITYHSQNTAIATVTPQGGTVTCRANGTTQIVATDARGATASYTLTVRGIKTLLRNDTALRSWTDGHNHCIARGGRLPSYSELVAFYVIYARENKDVAVLLGWPNIQSHPHIWFGVWLNGQNGIYHAVLTKHPGGGGPETTGARPTLCLIG